MTQLTTCLWFNGEAEEAADLYVSLFPDSQVTNVSRYGAGAPFPEGTALMVEFVLAGSKYQALNGGPQYTHSEAFSTSVLCEDQTEVDRYWDGLIANGGEEGRCGWLKDRFGVSWQVVPRQLGELLSDPDQARAGRVMQAMLGMSRLVVAELEAAAQG
jgi:predicted 3-demethylubiquinone-9 3-methyltransferase (glyoxalase superfamily)